MSTWKQGDTTPPMVIDCFDGTNRKADLSDAQTLKVIATRRGDQIWEHDVTGTGTADGVITMPLVASDTAVPGTYYVKVLATWADGTRQHYPPGDKYMIMTVTR